MRINNWICFGSNQKLTPYKFNSVTISIDRLSQLAINRWTSLTERSIPAWVSTAHSRNIRGKRHWQEQHYYLYQAIKPSQFPLWGVKPKWFLIHKKSTPDKSLGSHINLVNLVPISYPRLLHWPPALALQHHRLCSPALGHHKSMKMPSKRYRVQSSQEWTYLRY